MLWLWDHPEVSGLFNLGTGNQRSFNDLAAATFAAMDVEENIQYIDTPRAIRDRYQYFTCARMERLRDAGCSIEFIALEEGVRRYVSYLNQQQF